MGFSENVSKTLTIPREDRNPKKIKKKVALIEFHNAINTTIPTKRYLPFQEKNETLKKIKENGVSIVL